MENKKSKKIFGLYLAIFILSAGFLFFNAQTDISYAYSIDCADIETTALGVCTGGNSMLDANSNIKQNITCTDCATGPNSYCGKDNWNYCKWTPNDATQTKIPVDSPESKAVITANSPNSTAAIENGDVCPGVSKFPDLTWVACFLLVILKVIGWLLGVAVSLFAWVVDAEKMRAILVHPAIFKSWSIVRDFLNIGFILVLLFSAFSTIFQVDKYNYKKVLLWLVIMALLVNFSYPITRFIIDVSNVLMYTIMNNFFGEYAGDSQKILTQKMGGFNELQAIITASGAKTGLPQLLASIVFVFLLALTILSMVILFLIRTIALAILIIFSPVAFVGSILGKGGQWWDYLFKYAFFGPIMVFMLAISISIMKAMGSVPINNPGSESIVTSMSRFIIPIVVLWIGMGVAQQMGIKGASMALANAQGMAKWTEGLLKNTGMAGLKAIDRNTLAKWHVSPRQFLQAWKQSTVEAESDKLSAGTGIWHDRINRIFSRGKHKTNYADLERQKLVSKKSKELKEISEEAPYLLDKLSGSMGSDSPEAVAEMKAIFRIIYGNNDQDELMDYIRGNITKETTIGKKFEAMGFDEKNSTVSGENVSNAVIKLMEHSRVKPDEINKELLDLGNIAATKGGIGYGAVEYNQEAKQFERVTGIKGKEGKQAWAVASKIMTTGEAQNIPKTMHRNHFTDQDERLNEEGKALLRKYASPTAIKHIERHKPDFYKSICLETDADGATTADQMLLYASDLQKGTADGWDPNTKKHSTTLHNPEQALSAAAWTVALQTRAGVPKATIKNKLAGLFSEDDIVKILNLSTNQDVDAEPDSGKKGK